MEEGHATVKLCQNRPILLYHSHGKNHKQRCSQMAGPMRVRSSPGACLLMTNDTSKNSPRRFVVRRYNLPLQMNRLSSMHIVILTQIGLPVYPKRCDDFQSPLPLNNERPRFHVTICTVFRVHCSWNVESVSERSTRERHAVSPSSLLKARK